MAVYCCSDLHGMYNLYEKICAKLKPEDKVIFLGDANDRGPDGWKLIRAILDNPQWIYLMGNHEDMLVAAIDDIHEDVSFAGQSYACLLSIRNGGKGTIDAAIRDNDCFDIIDKLRNLPSYYHYISPSGVEYWLTHAGYTPHEDNNTPCNILRKTLVWDRNHMIDTDFPYQKDFYIIHGHTPIEYSYNYAADGDFMDRKYNSPYLYGNDMKIDIDAGAFYTNQTFLFNLDEFSFEVIEGGEDKNNG